MIDMPKAPRCDPDHDAENEPLATSGWQSTKRAVELLSYDEDDPDAASTVYLGKVEVNRKPRLLGFKDPRNVHMVTFASSGSGKTTTLLMPTMLTYRGDIVVIDPKGELASTTYLQRVKFGQKVIVIDPFRRARVPQEYRGALNPMGDMHADQPELLERVGAIVDSLVIKSDAKSLHFDEAARSFIKSVMLFILVKASEDDESNNPKEKIDLRSMALFREFVSTGINGSLDELIEHMLEVKGKYGPAIAAGANMIARTVDAERSGILSTIARSTEFLDSLDIQSALEQSTVDLSSLKQHPGTTIYLVLPEEYLDEYGRYLRMMLTTILNAIKRTPCGLHPKTGKPIAPLLFILEELAALGPMPQIERAAGILRGFGARLWFIWQDINQAKAHYPKTYDSLIGNASIVTAFGNGDNTTLEYLSKRLGNCEVRRITKQKNDQTGQSRSSGGLNGLWKEMANPQQGGAPQENKGTSQGSSTTEGEHIHTVPLMQPDEIGRYFSAHRQNMLVSITGALPIRLPRVAAYDDPFFEERLQPNPYHVAEKKK